MYQLFAFAAFIAVARAGNLIAPLTYSAAPLAVGAQHQSVVRTHDGNSAVSHYSKAVDTAFSSVRKYDTRVTNDAKLLAPAAFAYAAPAAPLVKAAPAFSYAAPAYTYAAAAPIVKAAPTISYAAPAYGYATGPIVKAASALSYAAPAYGYAAGPIVKAAPTLSYAAPAYGYAAAPIVKTAPIIKAAPALNYAAPAHYGYQTYAPSASYVAHTTFTGLGAHYEW